MAALIKIVHRRPRHLMRTVSLQFFSTNTPVQNELKEQQENVVTAKQPNSLKVTKGNSIYEVAKVGVSAFVVMSSLSVLNMTAFDVENAVLMSSFGGTCIMLCLSPAAPIAQPRNVIGGHMIGASCGLMSHACVEFLQTAIDSSGLSIIPEVNNIIHSSCLPMTMSGPMAVSTAAMLMMSTKTVHYPAGGTALGVALCPVIPYAADCALHEVLVYSEVVTLAHVFFSSFSLVTLTCLLHKGSYPSH